MLRLQLTVNQVCYEFELIFSPTRRHQLGVHATSEQPLDRRFYKPIGTGGHHKGEENRTLVEDFVSLGNPSSRSDKQLTFFRMIGSIFIKFSHKWNAPGNHEMISLRPFLKIFQKFEKSYNCRNGRWQFLFRAK